MHEVRHQKISFKLSAAIQGWKSQGEEVRPSGREVPGAAKQGSLDTAWLLSLKEGTVPGTKDNTSFVSF